jgi:hypothetical protein
MALIDCCGAKPQPRPTFGRGLHFSTPPGPRCRRSRGGSALGLPAPYRRGEPREKGSRRKARRARQPPRLDPTCAVRCDRPHNPSATGEDKTGADEAKKKSQATLPPRAAALWLGPKSAPNSTTGRVPWGERRQGKVSSMKLPHSGDQASEQSELVAGQQHSAFHLTGWQSASIDKAAREPQSNRFHSLRCGRTGSGVRLAQRLRSHAAFSFFVRQSGKSIISAAARSTACSAFISPTACSNAARRALIALSLSPISSPII